MSKWNQELWLSNINALIKKTGKSAREVETASGVAAGYISRVKTGRNNTVSAKFLVDSADYLNIDIETLMTVNLAQKESERIFIIKTLDKLINNIKKSNWKTWGESDLQLQVEHGTTTDEIKDFIPLVRFSGKGNYPFLISKFHPKLSIPLKDDHFALELTDAKSIILVQIEVKSQPEYEMYLVSPGYATPLCHTCDDSDINLRLAKLYSDLSIKIYTQPTLSQYTMDTIEELLFKK